MPAYDTKVIGFFAYASRDEIVCTDGLACVITGSQRAMEDYLKELDPGHNKMHTIRKTRFGEILQGIRQGAAYAFDKAAYAQFYPLAREEGLAAEQADFEEQELEGNRFFTVQIDI